MTNGKLVSSATVAAIFTSNLNKAQTLRNVELDNTKQNKMDKLSFRQLRQKCKVTLVANHC